MWNISNLFSRVFCERKKNKPLSKDAYGIKFLLKRNCIASWNYELSWPESYEAEYQI